MRKTKTIFQTLQDRDNADHVEKYGPFICTNSKAWLGKGFYFWDSFIENAHWWGEQNRSNRSYIICKSTIDYNDDLCYDLHGNTETLIEFQEMINQFKELKLLTNNSTLVEIINFLKKRNIFKHPSIRVSSQKFNNNQFQVKYHKKNPSWLELKPLIQICIYNLEKVNHKSFKIIYPKKYAFD